MKKKKKKNDVHVHVGAFCSVHGPYEFNDKDDKDYFRVYRALEFPERLILFRRHIFVVFANNVRIGWLDCPCCPVRNGLPELTDRFARSLAATSWLRFFAILLAAEMAPIPFAT